MNRYGRTIIYFTKKLLIWPIEKPPIPPMTRITPENSLPLIPLLRAYISRITIAAIAVIDNTMDVFVCVFIIKYVNN